MIRVLYADGRPLDDDARGWLAVALMFGVIVGLILSVVVFDYRDPTLPGRGGAPSGGGPTRGAGTAVGRTAQEKHITPRPAVNPRPMLHPGVDKCAPGATIACDTRR